MQKITDTVNNTTKIIKPTDSNYRFQINPTTGNAEVYYANTLVGFYDADGLHIPSGLNAYIGAGTSDPLARVADIPELAWSPNSMTGMRVTMGLTSCSITDGKCRDLFDSKNMTAGFTHNKLMTVAWSPSADGTPTGILPTALVGALVDGTYLIVACSGDDGIVQYGVDDNFYLSNLTATIGGTYTKFRFVAVVMYSTALGGFIPFEMGWDDDYYRFITPYTVTIPNSGSPSGETQVAVPAPIYSKAILRFSLESTANDTSNWYSASVYADDQPTPSLPSAVNWDAADIVSGWIGSLYAFGGVTNKEVAITNTNSYIKVLLSRPTKSKLRIQCLGYRWNRRF